MPTEAKISEMTAAGAFTGAELLEVVQGGVTLKGTAEQIKNYIVDNITSLLQGFDPKAAVRFRTTSNVDLAGGGLANGTTHDGVTAVTGDRVAVISQTAPAENGIYIVPASGAASRSTDADTWDELVGAYVPIASGTTYGNSVQMVISPAGGTLGTSPVAWTQVIAPGGYTSGTGISVVGNVISVDPAIVVTLSGTQVLLNKELSSPKITNALAAIAWMRVNADGTTTLRTATQTKADLGIDESASPFTIIAPDSSTAHLLKAADMDTMIVFNSASTCTLTVPEQATEANVDGLYAMVLNIGGGALQFAVQGSDTLEGVPLAQNPKQPITIYLRSAGTPNSWAQIGNVWKVEAVEDDALTAPPSTPALGAAYIPAVGATGAWSGQDGKFAIHIGSDAYSFVSGNYGQVVLEKTSDVFLGLKPSGWATL